MKRKRQPEKDTLPASRFARESRPSGFHSSGEPSGTRAVVAPPKPLDHLHAEMLRAVDRGECALLIDTLSDDGLQQQWSAWRSGQGHVVVRSWHRYREQTWSQGPSFTVEPTEVATLTQMLNKPPPA
jgi:hypothetical protein